MPSWDFKALLVDDELTIRKSITLYFSKKYPNIDFTVCEDGQEGLDAALDQKFDIILTDFRMPNLNGAEMIEQIRTESSYNKNTPIIMISSYIPEARAEMPYYDGVIFKDKPISFPDLVRTIKILVYGDPITNVSGNL